MQENHLFLFVLYHFEPRNAQLRRGTCVVPLTRKACEVLQCLVVKPGQLVTKAALFEAVWPETVCQLPQSPGVSPQSCVAGPRPLVRPRP